MKKIKQLVLASMLVFSLGLLVAPAASVSAVNAFPTCKGGSVICKAAADDKSADKFVKDVTNLLFFVIGVIAVIVIIVGGLKYVTSDGDSSKMKGAKDTILYAVVGLIVALLAYAIVQFVVGWF